MNQVVLNTPVPAGGIGKKDGIIRSWLDGQLAFEKTDVLFRDIATVRLDEFYFSTFHGGSDATWAPSHDSFASFSDMMVSTINPNQVTANASPVEILTGSQPHCRIEGSSLQIAHQGAKGLDFQVINLHGAVVQSYSTSGPGEYRFPLHVHPGMYFLRWSPYGLKQPHVYQQLKFLVIDG